MTHNKIKAFAISGVVISIIIVFSAGLIVGNLINFPFLDKFLKPQSSGISANDLITLNQVWEVIHTQYLNQPVNDEKIIRGAISGMMDSLEDPFSAYMSPEEFHSQNAPLKGEYSGIGAWVDTSSDYLIIISPMPDSPAEVAGLKPGDKVVAIDGEDMTALTPAQVLEHILGPEGTKITISIQREGVEEILQFKVERAVIPIPSVESELLDGNLGYIRLYTFGENSTKEITNALNSFISQDIKGLILDLRNNTGGYVETAIEITSLFIPEDVVMIEEWGDGTKKEYRTYGKPVATEIPLILLVNEGTASASEILAGALQDLERAELVGAQTFGKGYIQNWVPLREENGVIRVTIARWLTPNGRQIQNNGLAPDYQVAITKEDIRINRDAQLNRAIELFSQSRN